MGSRGPFLGFIMIGIAAFWFMLGSKYSWKTTNLWGSCKGTSTPRVLLLVTWQRTATCLFLRMGRRRHPAEVFKVVVCFITADRPSMYDPGKNLVLSHMESYKSAFSLVAEGSCVIRTLCHTPPSIRTAILQ